MTAVKDEAVTAEAVAADITIPRPRPHRTENGARWRALLEERWLERLQELTEMSVAYHEADLLAVAKEPHSPLRALSRRTAAARYALAETDQALHRLSAGDFGRCEDCAGQIPPDVLLAEPEARYCGWCAA